MVICDICDKDLSRLKTEINGKEAYICYKCAYKIELKKNELIMEKNNVHDKVPSVSQIPEDASDSLVQKASPIPYHKQRGHYPLAGMGHLDCLLKEIEEEANKKMESDKI